MSGVIKHAREREMRGVITDSLIVVVILAFANLTPMTFSKASERPYLIKDERRHRGMKNVIRGREISPI